MPFRIALTITTGYLDRALDPATPLAIRNSLLRFLSVSASDDDRLNVWAKQELKFVGAVVDPVEKQLEEAYKAVKAAKDQTAVSAAESVLRMAQSKYRELLNPPEDVVSAETLRAGLVKPMRDLSNLKMFGADLAKADR